MLMMPVVLLALVTAACGQTAKNVDVTQAKAMIDKGKVVVVDVRTPSEWNSGHLKGALHIDISSADFDKKIAQLAKDKPVVVYCAVGGRSARAASAMAGKGITTVYNMSGGIQDWTAKGYPVVK